MSHRQELTNCPNQTRAGNSKKAPVTWTYPVNTLEDDEMSILRVVVGQDIQELEVSENMARLSDEEILSYVREATNRPVDPEDFVVDRTENNNIVVRPRAVYG